MESKKIVFVYNDKKETDDKLNNDLIEKVNQFERDNILLKFQKVFLGQIDEFEVYAVNGDFMKLFYPNRVDENGNPVELPEELKGQFCEAGNGYRYPTLIDKNHIYVDWNIHSSDWPPNTLHEIDEARNMRDNGMDYETAHNIAQLKEMKYRLIRLNIK